MHPIKDVTASIDCENSDGKITSTDVLIIGFGLSAIPLIRELEKDGIDYVILSDGDGSIWDKLERHGRLDFDLVSSVHTSLYSFELVERDAKDRYPTSKEYLAFIRKYLTRYGSRVIKDWVT
jgi:cation diffusion facilitator CzcD-associated flavoprotein CzcO